ncbi:hypothetical protein [Deinococcus sonorensis]|uniref:Uncharacterized protein n=2 Tax=Deinococcus sonorensis TaxID=309891 RepID=A0AAU7U6D3_9DEIO
MYRAELIVNNDVQPLGSFPTAPQARLHCFRHMQGLLKLHWYEVEDEMWVAYPAHGREFRVRQIDERDGAQRQRGRSPLDGHRPVA